MTSAAPRPRSPAGLLAAVGVVAFIWLASKVYPHRSIQSATRGYFAIWAWIGLLAFLRRRSLAPLLGAGRAEGWAAVVGGAVLAFAFTERYYALVSSPILPLERIDLSSAAPLHVLGVGLYEELGFRGVVLEGLKGVCPPLVAHALTVLSFPWIHFRPLELWPPILAFGILFGVLREYARSLWPCVLAHSLINLGFAVRYSG